MKTLTFAVLFLSASGLAAAGDGMPQVLTPKEDAAPVPADTAAPAQKPAAPAAEPVAPAPVVVQAPPAVKGAGFAITKTHTVTGGDTLWDLSNRYYSDPYRWGKIYNANLGTVANPDLIYPSEVLVIPDLTEEVQPAGAKAPEITGGDTVKEAEFTGSDVSQPEGALAAAAPAAQATPAKAELGDMLREYDANDLSEEMPEHQKEWSSAVNIVPDSWIEDGVIAAAEKGKEENMEESIAVEGGVVLVSMNGGTEVKKGDYLEVYLKGTNAFDKSGKKLGREIQQAGTLQVISAEGLQARARVIEAATAIVKGYLVKKK